MMMWDRTNVIRIMLWGIVLLTGALALAQSEDSGAEIQRPSAAQPKCGTGEEWSDCGSSCPKSCDNRDNTCRMCRVNCVPGCFCAGATVRGPNNTCIETKNCPNRTCSGANEFFDPCPKTCPKGESCDNLWFKTPCTSIDCCEPKCRCKTGYYKNDQNKCISADECKRAGRVAKMPIAYAP